MTELEYIRSVVFSNCRLDKHTRILLERAACRLPDWFVPTKRDLFDVCNACVYSNRKGLKLLFR